MKTASTSVYDNPTFDMTVYTVRQLHDEVGRQSEENVVMLMEQVLKFAHVNYEIHYDLPVQDGYPDYQGGCDPPFHEWNQDVIDRNIPHTAEDSNLLLVNGGGGGCSNAPSNNPNRCIAGARPMANMNEYQIAGCGPQINSAHDILHEVGHNLGFGHVPHGGFGHNGDDDNWWRTPTVGGNDLDNLCGEHIEERVHGPSCRYLFYHWCALEHSDYPNENPPSPPPRNEYPPTVPGQTVPYREKLPRPPAECTDGSACPDGEICEDGTCVPGGPCAGVECPAGETCHDGLCVECMGDMDCPVNQVCSDGSCETPGDNGGGLSRTQLAVGGVLGGALLWTLARGGSDGDGNN